MARAETKFANREAGWLLAVPLAAFLACMLVIGGGASAQTAPTSTTNPVGTAPTAATPQGQQSEDGMTWPAIAVAVVVLSAVVGFGLKLMRDIGKLDERSSWQTERLNALQSGSQNVEMADQLKVLFEASFHELNARIERMDARFTGMDDRFHGVESEIRNTRGEVEGLRSDVNISRLEGKLKQQGDPDKGR
jgi:hypothetical protein